MKSPPLPADIGQHAGTDAVLGLLRTLERLPMPVMAVDSSDPTRIVFWNQACELLSGYRSSEIVDRTDAVERLYPDAAYRSRKLAEWPPQGETADPLELTLMSRNRKPVRIAWSVVGGLDRQLGQPATRWLIGQDMTALTEANRQSRARQRLLVTVFRNLPDGVTLKDGDGRLLITSPSIVKSLGISEAEAVGLTALELAERTEFPEAALRQIASNEEATWQAGCLSQMDEVVDFGGGLQRFYDVTRVPTYGRLGQRVSMLVIRRETSEQRSAATQLELAGRVVEQSSDGIFITNASNQITMVNAAFTHITGFASAEALGQQPAMFASGLHEPAFFAAMWNELKSSGCWAGEVWNRRKNREVYPLWMNLSVLHHRVSGEITHYVASFSDLSSRKAAEQQIAFLSTKDPITGLPNRSQIALSGAIALSQAKANGETFAVLMIDVDNFKTLNDSLSYAAGDQLLRVIGERLARSAGERAAVGRLSGDEFLVLLPGASGTNEVAQAARSLMAAVAEPMELSNVPFHVTVSVGIATYPGDGDDFDVLFGRADAALYQAKRSGRAAYQFSSVNMNQQALERLQIESALRRAIEQDALRLEYQPLIEIATGRIMGCEALCRWDDPQRGAIPPEVFIALAEDNGLIERLGAWVLRTATRQLADWQQSGHTDLMMAVNLSARQFQRGVVLQQVEDALRSSGVEPGSLELELTETVLLNDGVAVLDTLRVLKSLGVSLAIDDFGTGYSSFAYLRRFKFDKIKIDQSFIRDLIDDPDDAAIVRGIISLGANLGLAVVAEGVETEAVAQRLRGMQCAYAQGYFYARPLRPALMRARLEAQSDGNGPPLRRA